MDHELIFSGAGMLAMVGWLLLVISPWVPIWSDRVAGFAIPLALSVGYLAVIVLFPADTGGFGSFTEISELFSNPQALMAGWIHFLAFDLFIGAWICRKARAKGVPFWLVLPCLPVTFLVGPAGFLLFSIVLAGNAIWRKQLVPAL